jgi:hypothetical protein
MRYLVAVTETHPLSIHFSLHNPPGSDEAIYVPKPLGPLGAFVRVAVEDADGDVVHRTVIPKIRLKLDPNKAESYLVLEPGYTHGVVLTVEGLRLEPGDYRLRVEYSNLPYRGFAGHPLGELAHDVTLPLRVD